MSGHYKTNKKVYDINLRLSDAISVGVGSVPNSIFKVQWNQIPLITLSKQAQMGIVRIIWNGVNGGEPHTIRCLQCQNNQYDSSGTSGAIIYMGQNMETPPFSEMYPLSVQVLDTITLIINTGINVNDTGVALPIPHLYIQLKVEDYDIEEVDEKLMPTYNKKSLSYHY